MTYIFKKMDITEFEGDAIINASNGIGYMGGLLGKFIKFNGIAESIHFKTKGSIEKEAKKECRKFKYIPNIFTPLKTGEIFITSAANLKVKYIIHAVTMQYPGSISCIETIETLILKIISKANELKINSIAIPLLGTGTGKLSKDEVIKLYEKIFSSINNLNITIVYEN